jgi:hypothetical protein
VVANALLITIAILLGFGFWLLGQLKFLVPYKSILTHQCAGPILLWVAVWFINVFAAVYVVQRKFFLKDTGRKLSHIDNEVQSGDSAIPLSSPFNETDTHVP